MRGVVVLCIFICVLSSSSLSKPIERHNDIIGQPDRLGVDYPLVDYPKAGMNVFGSGQYYYVAVEGKVRVNTVHAVITKANLDTGSDTTTTTRDWAHSQGLPNDDAGHILANRLGGSGKDPVNIFPQNLSVNRGTYRVFEGLIADCLVGTPGVIASLDWMFTYLNATTTRPNGVTYCVEYDRTPICATSSVCQKFTN